MRKMLVAAVMLCGALAASAEAQDRGATGFTFGLRTGWAKPLGTLAGEEDRGNQMSFDREFGPGVPLIVEAGYRLGLGLTLGGYFQYAFTGLDGGAGLGLCASPGTTCDDGRDLRIGAQLTYHLIRVKPFTPWFGLGAGYEWASYDVSGPTGSGTMTYKGFELLNLQAGGDIAVSPRFSVGPFVSMSIARFSTQEIASGGASVSFELSQKRIHDWLQLGVRATFDL